MKTVAYWIKKQSDPVFNPNGFPPLISAIRNPLHIVFDPNHKLPGLAADGTIESGRPQKRTDCFPLIGSMPALYPEWLGDRSFPEAHRVRYSYVGGDMARGISSSGMAIELARSGMMGFLGSAGMRLSRVEREIMTIKDALEPASLPWGVNLIHNPDDPALEKTLVELYLRLGVRRMSASAFMNITPGLVHFACNGLHVDERGRICRKNFIFAKISRPEVATGFLEPAPDDMVSRLVEAGMISREEARLARQIPLAEDITVEADSGGHTDNRPLNVLFPVIAMLREKIAARYGYKSTIRLGAAGGLGTPDAVAAAFSLGAAYVLVGTVHQTCVESGMSREGKKLLAQAGLADVIMTPSADMFELSGKVQVLKKGTMMGVRGIQLYQLYTQYGSLGEIPDKVRSRIEKTIFRMPMEQVWEKTREFFGEVDPRQIEKARQDEKHKMALIFRWYLGNSSKWAVAGDPDRTLDYQIWCGPAIGSFNAWIRGSFLEAPENRNVRQVALNLMEGAAVITRAQQLRTYGVPVPGSLFVYRPVPLRIA